MNDKKNQHHVERRKAPFRSSETVSATGIAALPMIFKKGS
jgi:hypothetical protein